MTIPTQEERIATFQEKIKARKAPGVTWLETITDYCEENGIDVEDIVTLISPWIKSRIHEESVGLNLVKASSSERKRIGI